MCVTKEFFSVFVLTSENMPVPKQRDLVFAIKHGEQYKIKVVNHHPTLKANASVAIDNKNVGYFQVNADSSIVIERPEKQAKRFTFYEKGSKEADQARILNDGMPGMLRVTIEQEQEPFRPATNFWLICEDVADCAGGTGLSGQSTQTFVSASSIKTKDKVVVINALMVVDKSGRDISPL